MTDLISASDYSRMTTLHIDPRSYAGFQVDTVVSSLETHGIQALDDLPYDYIPSRLFQSFP